MAVFWSRAGPSLLLSNACILEAIADSAFSVQKQGFPLLQFRAFSKQRSACAAPSFIATSKALLSSINQCSPIGTPTLKPQHKLVKRSKITNRAMANTGASPSTGRHSVDARTLEKFRQVMDDVYGPADDISKWAPKPYKEGKGRSLWTDAFGVCNFLTLFYETGETKYRQQVRMGLAGIG